MNPIDEMVECGDTFDSIFMASELINAKTS